ncbi:IS3 family transposase, partial [Streptomyces sp. NPDC001817]|uniref:IS3 family transposase n=1 Tax=Streptomyces sp. NPDC001817 TaxID=3154398 RepID=UPI00332A7B22
MAEKIRAIHTDSDGTYGAPRITAELRDTHGMVINEKKAARVMRKFRITGVRLRKRVRTTVPEPSQTPVPDLFKRDFQGCFKVPVVAESCRSRWCDACWPSRLVHNEA